MHKTGWYIDLRIVFTHSFEHEIPNLVFNLVSLEKKFGAIVSWVLKTRAKCRLYHEVVGPSPLCLHLVGVRASGLCERKIEDMMYYTTKFCSEANPNPKPNSKSTLSKSQKRRHEMRLPRGYVDFRWVFRHLV